MPIQELQKAQSKLASAVVDNHKKVMSAIEELKVMLTEDAKASFQVKGSHIEVWHFVSWCIFLIIGLLCHRYHLEKRLVCSSVKLSFVIHQVKMWRLAWLHLPLHSLTLPSLSISFPLSLIPSPFLVISLFFPSPLFLLHCLRVNKCCYLFKLWFLCKLWSGPCPETT